MWCIGHDYMWKSGGGRVRYELCKKRGMNEARFAKSLEAVSTSPGRVFTEISFTDYREAPFTCTVGLDLQYGVKFEEARSEEAKQEAAYLIIIQCTGCA